MSTTEYSCCTHDIRTISLFQHEAKIYVGNFDIISWRESRGCIYCTNGQASVLRGGSARLELKYRMTFVTSVCCRVSVPNCSSPLHTFYCGVLVMNKPISAPLYWLLVNIVELHKSVFLHYYITNILKMVFISVVKCNTICYVLLYSEQCCWDWPLWLSVFIFRSSH